MRLMWMFDDHDRAQRYQFRVCHRLVAGVGGDQHSDSTDDEESY